MKQQARGLLIALEGIDGAGKSTHAVWLQQWLEARGRRVVLLHEPTRGPHGLRLRALMSAGRDAVSDREEFQLFLDDRRQNVVENIAPALERGDVVLMDRYYVSSMAYQGARGLDPAMIRTANEAFAPVPDIVVLFMLPVDEALKRIRRRHADGPNLFEHAAALERAQEIYRGLEGFPAIATIDASLPMKEVQEKLAEAVKPLL